MSVSRSLRALALGVSALTALGALTVAGALPAAAAAPHADVSLARAATTATPSLDLPAPDWQKYVQGPASSTVRPVKVLSTTGDVANAAGAIGDGVATLTNAAPPAWPSGTTAAASSTAGSNTDNGVPRSYGADHAIDSDTSTFWNDATIGAYPDQLTITSPSAVSLPGITLLSSSDGVPQDYTVEALVGGTWTTEATVTGSTDLQHEVPFASTVSATGIRLTVTKDQSTGKGEYTRVTEVYPGLVGANDPASITLDFGKVVVGYTHLSFDGASAGAARPGLRLAFSETQQYLSPTSSDFTRSDNGDTITPGTDQVAVPEQPGTWVDAHGCGTDGKVCADGLHGFRYLTISLAALASDAPDTTSVGSVRLDDVSLDFTAFVGTPDTYTGWFESSDDALNTAWYDAVYTNELITDTFRSDDVDPRNADTDTLDGELVLHDGAKRDRDPYVGDVYVSGLTTYLTHDTAVAARNVLADLGDHQRSDGWIPPASISNYTLPLFDYPLYWVTASTDYVRYTGDTDYADQYYAVMRKTLDDFYPSMTDANGLLSRPSSYGDYAFLGRNGEVTYYNALYVLALTDAARLAGETGHADDAAEWTSRAASVGDAINSHLWDADAGAYLDAATGAVRHGQDGNGYAVVAGVAGSDRATSALDYMASATSLPYGNAFMDNDTLVGDGSQRVYAFTSFPDIEARFMSGQADSAIDEITRLYGWMQSHDPGTTDWEGIGAGGSMYEQGFTSSAHGWSTGVVPALSNQLLGAQPVGIGFDTWSVQPHPGSVAWSQGALPTPHGDLGVKWSNPGDGAFALEVDAPAGTSGDIAVPVSNPSATVTLDGTVVWAGSAVAGSGATLADGYVTVHGVGAGTHELTVVSGLEVSVQPGADVAPGGVAHGTVHLMNPGASAVTGVSVVLAASGGLAASPAAVTADEIAAGDSVDLPFTVSVPSATAAGDLSVALSITATIGGRVERFDVDAAPFATVTQAVALDPLSADVGAGDPAQTATVHATVTNHAAVAETGRLVVDAPDGWPMPSPSRAVTIAPEASADLTATLSIPTSVTAGAQTLSVHFVADSVTLGSATTSADITLADPPASPLDYVDFGNGTSETAHSVTSTGNGGTSTEAGRTRRYSGSTVVGAAFTATMHVTPGQPFVLRAVETYDGPQTKAYDILVNGTRVATRLHASSQAGLVTFQTLVSDTSLTTSGSVQVTFRYNGQAGYDPSISDAWTLAAPADTTAPTVALEVSHPGVNGWHLAGAQATITAQDAGTVASIEYRLGDGDWQAYTGPIALPEGTTAVGYRATDAAGNTSAEASESVRVDATTPTAVGAHASADGVVVAAQDAGAGVSLVQVSATGARWYDSLAEAVADDAGPITRVRAVDLAGNVSPVAMLADDDALPLVAGAVHLEASGFAPGAIVPLSLAPDGAATSATADAQGVAIADATVTAGGTQALHFGIASVTAPAITGSFAVGATLTAGTGTWNAPVARLSLAYQWLLDGSSIDGATAASFTVPASALGRSLSVRVTADAPDATAPVAATAAPSVVTAGGSTSVIATTPPAMSGTPTVGSTLTATSGEWSLPDDQLDFAYQWVADGEPIAGATAATYRVTSALLGEAVGVVVTATVGGGTATGSAASALVTITDAQGGTVVANRTAPSIQGAVRVGTTVSSTLGVWNLSTSALTFTYQWTSDGVAIAGATKNRFYVTTPYLGHRLAVIVTASPRAGSSASAGSRAIAVTGASTTTIALDTSITIRQHDRVTVTVASPAAKESGRIVLHVGTTQYTAAIDVHGHAVLVLPLLASGRHSVWASYAGAGSVLASRSATSVVTVTR